MEYLEKWGGVGITLTCGILIAILFFLCFPSGFFTWFFLAIIGFFTISAAYGSYSLSAWYPTRTGDLKRIVALAQLQPAQKFYDLGCGDGRVVVYVSQNTKAFCLGIEISHFHYLLAKMRELFYSSENLQIKRGNLFNQDLSEADVVYVYGCPSTIKKVFGQKFEDKFKKGVKIISYEHAIEGWKPSIISQNAQKLAIYVYTNQ